MIKFLDLRAQYLSIQSEIDAAIKKTLLNSAFVGGDSVRDFEREFAEYQAADYCVGVGNGTDALEVALEGLGLPKGSEIIVPANSFIASSEAVTRAGYRVRFADIDPDSFLLDPDDVKRRLTDQVSAIMVVHLYGQPCDMGRIQETARINNLKIVEDCAQAHGAEYSGTRVGTIGDVGTFSFYPGKNLGAYGDAGAIVTNDEALAARCRMIANHGRIDKYDHQFEGRNSRLDGLQAEILRVKLRHLEDWLERRIHIADLYTKHLGDIGEIRLPKTSAMVRHVYHLYVIRTQVRDQLADYLARNDIATGIHYPIALPKLKAYSHLAPFDGDMIANRQDSQLLSLPIGEHMTDEDTYRVASVIRRFFS